MDRTRRLRAAFAVPTLALAALGVAAIPASAHSMMAAHTWKGTVAKVHAMMGMHESFALRVGSHTYLVDYTTHTRFAMGRAAAIKAGAKITVDGTLKGSTITATSLSV